MINSSFPTIHNWKRHPSSPKEAAQPPKEKQHRNTVEARQVANRIRQLTALHRGRTHLCEDWWSLLSSFYFLMLQFPSGIIIVGCVCTCVWAGGALLLSATDYHFSSFRRQSGSLSMAYVRVNQVSLFFHAWRVYVGFYMKFRRKKMWRSGKLNCRKFYEKKFDWKNIGCFRYLFN